MSGLIC